MIDCAGSKMNLHRGTSSNARFSFDSNDACLVVSDLFYLRRFEIADPSLRSDFALHNYALSVAFFPPQTTEAIKLKPRVTRTIINAAIKIRSTTIACDSFSHRMIKNPRIDYALPYCYQLAGGLRYRKKRRCEI
ncbi:hypothetical protein TSAR_001440 [Trichomalopsis sarcophagae]|uniref:Uncharacterized protein n=1 Tax=Trichomalopsis sarcophagae TaxID=543379 RepID=A0A232EUU9_9HYME|nr:hypothetical protein TSAR_001440 [Trichomalopsis sarcophagae]